MSDTGNSRHFDLRFEGVGRTSGKMRNDISARLHWRAEQIDDKPYVSEPVGFALDVQIEADCSMDQRVALLNAARKGCFIEQSLTLGTTISHRLKTDDGWLDCP